ncbi:methylmalonyl-CoA mutase family protein [Desulfogranum mediterraneum]|uniref:methylmalonyl-CoA mutase family protein n=1 Tax=Desulfogranum mediterraneum TaxID=160661 RepID=UPI0003FFA717|nr:methylmalonyl-CoA mutase family protein [Desulfogranum mediterraneum]
MAEHALRILTAVARYDGHDASVLALNRALLRSNSPVEIIYLGYHAAAEQICTAALQEDVQGLAVASYNGGHMQFFPHLLSLLKAQGGQGIQLFGGGGATISAQEAARLEQQGVTRIYGPELSLDAVAGDIITRLREGEGMIPELPDLPLAKRLSLVEELHQGGVREVGAATMRALRGSGPDQAATLVITGDGGAGKSTIIDELVSRFLETYPEKRLVILANDPTTVRGQGHSALLADRVRMNAIYDPRVFMRSCSTGRGYTALSPALPEMVSLCRSSGADLVMVETPGVGQVGVDLAALAPDLSLCVKTREYGSSLQLAKDQMLQDADLVVLNKVDLAGAETALQDLSELMEQRGSVDPPIGVLAKVHRDPGMDHLFAVICARLGWQEPAAAEPTDLFSRAGQGELVPHGRRNYLAEVARSVRDYDRWVQEQLGLLRDDPERLESLAPHCRQLLKQWPATWQRLTGSQGAGEEGLITTANGYRLPRLGLPDPADRVESLRFLLEEGLPGVFPYATGIYPWRLPAAGKTTRQFAGLRGPGETNERLHFLNRGIANPRLSIAFDGITLYGEDSDGDPGSRGKIGEGGVAVDSYEDMKLILKGFDVRKISTSMTINGPAPVILAMYFVAALELEEERLTAELGRALSPEEGAQLETETFTGLRGTVQADILKEVQAQNECIFAIDFAMRMVGDVQRYFIDHRINSFYSLSISGYHIGEAGATPAQELAFTLANGFTYVEYFLKRQMAINAFAPSLSFFFRVSHEAEWLAYGPVCRKIWAIALRDRYGADSRSQRFKFHTQTSGRALQAQEWDTLNPIRQTYHAYLGLLNNTNSLHIDSADEPMTTPSQKYVRQAAMIPNYLQEEAEAFAIQNLLSGSYGFRAMARQLQAAILKEFERIDQLGGVAAATELGYQRNSIGESSARYEQERVPDPLSMDLARRKIIGFNTYLQPLVDQELPSVPQLVRPTQADWDRQISRVRDFRSRHQQQAEAALQRLEAVAASDDGNIFAELLRTVRCATLGQISARLRKVGGSYRKMV